MAFYSGFFNSKGLDRTYTAEDFTEYLSSIICNGILDTYGQNFSLTASAVGLRVILGTGKAWINGHYFVNDTRHTIDLTEYQDESLPRYVAISILLDTSENVWSVSLEITPGTPAESPSLPSFPQSENKARLLMYAVRLNVGATSLTERDWYDYRKDKNVCGYCKCILGKCKVTEMQSQLAAITAKINEYNEQVAELTSKVDMLQTKIDDLTGDIVATGSLGENIYYVKYSNCRLLLRGTGATYDYDLGESPFWEDEDIRSLVISEGITAIGDSVFERCSNMTSVSFPNTLESIGKRAFFMYTTGGLTSLNLPASVTRIDEKAFANLAAVSLVLPENLTELGTYLFMDSDTLQNLSPYITRVEVLKIVDDKVHSSAPDLSPYVTRVETQKLIESKFQTVENDLTSLENTVNSEIQDVKDSVEPVVSQAHWHHNLTLLNSLTSAKIAKWDKISDIETELQQLRDSTQYDQQNQDDAILNLENRITILESQLASGNNAVTLFSAGADALEAYGESIYTFYNDGYRSLSGFAETYPNFCSAENNRAIYYNQPDFNWGATIYTLCTEPVLITSSKSILFRYTSGAADIGEMWLVPKSSTEMSAAETARYIHESIVSGTAVPVPFSWLQSPENDSTVLLPCENVMTGDYYLAWKVVTDNTHPKIKLIKVLEG